MQQAAIKFLEDAAQNPNAPFFINVNFIRNHQPNLPAPEFEGTSISKSDYADLVVELDTRVGNLLDEPRLADSTVVFHTVDNGAWQDVYPDAGHTPFHGNKGTVREGGNRAPTMVRWPGQVAGGSVSHDILGCTDLMATFAALAGQDLPTVDREDQPIAFDSCGMTQVLAGPGPSEREDWFHFAEEELTPGAVRVGNFKYVFNLRGDDGAATGGLAVDTNLGWKGPETYVATVPQVFVLLADPQERYDVFMTTFTESTWAVPPANEAVSNLMKTFVQYPPRKLRSETYTGPIMLSQYQRFGFVAQRC